MWRFHMHTRNVFFSLYEVWGSPKRGGGRGDPNKLSGSAPASHTPIPECDLASPFPHICLTLLVAASGFSRPNSPQWISLCTITFPAVDYCLNEENIVPITCICGNQKYRRLHRDWKTRKEKMSRHGKEMTFEKVDNKLWNLWNFVTSFGI